jgi:hypothetical protein
MREDSFYSTWQFVGSDFFGYALCPRMTERERCEWAGVEYLESDYQHPSLSSDRATVTRDTVGIVQHTLRDIAGHADMVRHFGFGQDPHE